MKICKNGLFVILLLIVFILTSCNIPGPSDLSQGADGTNKPYLITHDTQTAPTPTFFQPLPSTATFTPLPTSTPTNTPTDTPTPTETPLPTFTATWSTYSAGDVIVPILLYHHVADLDITNRYAVSIDSFKAQMQKLKDWDYTPITLMTMVDVLLNGGSLPPRPVVITFDDGNLDIYDNAFPIMKKNHFPGVFYIVSSRLESTNYVSAEQLKEMVKAGWEIGSHSMTHADLTTDHSIVRNEILQSRLDLEDALGVPVKSFAYSFGLTDEYIATKVQDYGYLDAVGLGTSNEHTWSTLYYLSRREVHGEYDLSAFTTLLPWIGRLGSQ